MDDYNDFLYSDDPTAVTGITPPETAAGDLPSSHDEPRFFRAVSSSTPWPGSVFIIRSTSSVVTARNNEIVLAPPNGSDSTHWACVETNGWLGFQNIHTGNYLGHDLIGRLTCSVKHHNGWEHFCARMTPDGGYVLLMRHWDKLRHVGVIVDGGVEKLAKKGDGGCVGIVWEFVKI